MNQTPTATMHFRMANTHPAVTRWWTEAESVISAAVRWLSTPAAAEPASRAAYHSYLEQVCMAREMDRL
ncbi:hypothetical protein [Mycolicibacterium mucogenicum]|uniref:Uncharacterized protein n=2 Tax=Mycolicibacterium mucogenicum DSM 44124 TaxID=1226753 RepID=A0A8E4RB35_MYCMU|nr:hypothetical protein [Mycolicibacterium mucogenicum]QPG70907.1 hypothetical protein C1S78_008155 [Mycolicibacterium mucogenicum DSM 44124]